MPICLICVFGLGFILAICLSINDLFCVLLDGPEVSEELEVLKEGQQEEW